LLALAEYVCIRSLELVEAHNYDAWRVAFLNSALLAIRVIADLCGMNAPPAPGPDPEFVEILRRLAERGTPETPSDGTVGRTNSSMN